jgi:hypothetical protein
MWIILVWLVGVVTVLFLWSIWKRPETRALSKWAFEEGLGIEEPPPPKYSMFGEITGYLKRAYARAKLKSILPDLADGIEKALYCDSCGSYGDPEWVFCDECGAELNGTTE